MIYKRLSFVLVILIDKRQSANCFRFKTRTHAWCVFNWKTMYQKGVNNSKVMSADATQKILLQIRTFLKLYLTFLIASAYKFPQSSSCYKSSFYCNNLITLKSYYALTDITYISIKYWYSYNKRNKNIIRSIDWFQAMIWVSQLKLFYYITTSY